MKSWNWRNILLSGLGVITTGLTFVIIYLILYERGEITLLDQNTIIEFCVMIVLTITVRSFWYSSTENTIRNSVKYLTQRDEVIDYIDTEIESPYDFDKFIDNENLHNYNVYVSNHCRVLTIDNFRLSFKDKLYNFFRTKKHKKNKYFFFNRYVRKIEQRGTKLHKLSAANIMTLCKSTNGLTDDRNNARKAKLMYLIGGSILSAIVTFVTAMISFSSRDDVDKMAAALKMLLYAANIGFSIVQSVIKAYMTVNYEDYAYFRKVTKLLDKYVDFKSCPVLCDKVDYILMEPVKEIIVEVKDASIINKPIEENIQLNFNDLGISAKSTD